MADGDGLDPGEGLAPEAVENADFGKVRRGYEPGPVRSRLRQAAEEIRRLQVVIASLQQRIAELEALPPERLEAAQAVEALGDEAARVLQAARDAARERLERATSERGEMIAEARTAAAAIVEEGREEGRELVIEARNHRERILSDLAYKRHAHRVEVEQLRVVHDRLVEAVSICREGLDGWIADLVQASPRAEAAAARAGLRVAAEPEPTVGEMEAEIQAARLAGLALDAGSGQAGDEEDATSDTVSEPPPDPDIGAQTADPGVAESDEAVVLEELDELEEETDDQETSEFEAGEFEANEYVEIVGYKDDPPKSAARAPVGLYDVEAESEFEVAEGPGTVYEPDPGIGSLQLPETGRDSTPAVGAAPDAEAIFARLRSITSRPAAEPSPGSDPHPAAVAVPADERSEEAAPVEASGPGDLVDAARAVAVGGIARRLKRLVVDEQSELLDALRRSGSRALRTAIAADAGPYARAAVAPLQDFASDIDVSIDDIDLKSASAAIVSVLVEPVRSRLSEMIEETDDPDELARTVRSIYRESRSRRAEAAAEAAFSAGWPEAVS